MAPIGISDGGECMDVAQLNTFKAVAALGSFSKAADLLDLAQSTVSAHVAALESALGAELFARGGNRIALSAAGERFLVYAQRMIDLEDEAKAALRGGAGLGGALSARICEPICESYLPRALKRFRAEHPRVRLDINSCSPYGLLEELRSGRIDFALLIVKGFIHPDLDAVDLLEIPLAFAAPPGSALARRGAVGPAELAGETVFVPTGYCVFYLLLEDLFRAERMPLPPLHCLNSVAAIKRNVAAGIGSALLPRVSVEEELSDGRLAELRLEAELPRTSLALIREKGKRLPPAAEAFIEIARGTMR